MFILPLFSRHSSQPHRAVGTTTVQKITLHVAMLSPFLRMPIPEVAFKTLLALLILSSTPEVLSGKIEVFTPTWLYSVTSLTLSKPSFKGSIFRISHMVTPILAIYENPTFTGIKIIPPGTTMSIDDIHNSVCLPFREAAGGYIICIPLGVYRGFYRF